MITPIELLQEKLSRLWSARHHSFKAVKEGKIDKELHETHVKNLTPIIESYKFAITMLKKYT